MDKTKLDSKIANKKVKVAVIGLGYVGLPIALEFVKKGFFVYGLDNNKERVDNLIKGSSYITDIPSKSIRRANRSRKFSATIKESVLADSDVVIICVPTPLRKRKIPNISYIIKASRTIAKYLHRGQLVVLESTTYPGTTRDVLLPILESKGLKEGKDFFVAFSPERIDPGNVRYTFAKIPKIVGGLSPKAAKLTQALYAQA
ncbi:MAG: nucleotide sugar dehydrogenase, partial [Candidatus Omnitrophica bacterium]|nr:nucleotide sugar dehydrogenase [Candidatus Omnitrophota bacterium]